MAALPKDLNLVPSTHIVAHSHLYVCFRALEPRLTPQAPGSVCMDYTDCTQQNIHIHKIKGNIKISTLAKRQEQVLLERKKKGDYSVPHPHHCFLLCFPCPFTDV